MRIITVPDKETGFLSSTESYITGESLNSYLSGDGEMRITYKMDASDEYGPAPVLSLIYKKQ